MKNLKNMSLLFVAVALMLSCTPSVPSKYNSTGVTPQISPDYTGVTVPVNIAPLVFEIDELKANTMEAVEMMMRALKGEWFCL